MAQVIKGYIDYVTTAGDTFDMIALAAYDDELLASTVIEANLDYCDVLIFDAGTTLRIPVIDNVESPASLPPWRR